MKRTIRTVPKIRTVKPEFFKHEELFDAEFDYRLPLRIAFIGLITCCDREGRFRWQPRRLKSDTLPFDNVDMGEVLEALVERGFVKKYEYEGKWYGCIPSFLRHQRINSRESESIFPSSEGFAQAKPRTAPQSFKVEKNVAQANIQSEASILNDAISEKYLPTEEKIEKAAFTLDRPSVDLQTSHTEIEALKGSDLSVSQALTEKTNINNEIAVDFSQNALNPCQPLNHADVCTCTHMQTSACACGKEGKGKEGNGIERKKGEENNNVVASSNRPRSGGGAVQEIFEHWKTVMQHPNAKLDLKRKHLITQALKLGYSVSDLCQAITGCSLTPHNMGQNDRNQRYDGLHVVLRDADQIDRFMRHYHSPPRLLTQAERKTQANVRTLQDWMIEKMREVQAYESH